MGTFDKLDDARAHALAQSKLHPKFYYTITTAFGWMVTRAKRLSVFAPSDATDWSGRTGTYWLNGQEKPFTVKQKIMDDLKTPTSR